MKIIKSDKFLIIFPFLYLLLALIIYRISPDFYSNRLAGGEQIIEGLQFILYFLGAILSFMSLRFVSSKTVKLILLMTGLVFFFIAMEEISWGQKIFHWNTPEEIKNNNSQGETTIHNLEFIQGNFLLHTAFILFGTFLALVPFVTKLKVFKVFSIIQQKASLFFFFIIPAFYYACIQYFQKLIYKDQSDWIIKVSEQELIELLLALGVFLSALYRMKIANPNKQITKKSKL